MNNYKKAMGERLRCQRRLQNLTQEQLAEKIDISVKHYSEAERGITGLSVENIIKISEIFGVSIDYLLKGITIDYPVPLKIIDIYSNCPNEKKSCLLKFLELSAELYS